MADLITEAKKAVGDLLCAGLGGTSWVAGLLSEKLGVGENIQEMVDRQRVLGCGGSPDEIEEVLTPPQFSGGQCSGQEYIVTLDVTYTNGNGTDSIVTIPLPGAIGETPISSNILRIPYLDGAWEYTRNLPYVVASIDNVTVTPFNPSEGDNCGSLPSKNPAPISRHDDVISFTYDKSDGTTADIIDAPITFFPPCIDLFDGVRVPFEIDFGFTKMCGKGGVGWDLPDIVEPTIDIDVCPSQKDNLSGEDYEQKKEYFSLDAPRGFSGVSADPLLDATNSTGIEGEQNPILGVFIESSPTVGEAGGKEIILQEAYETFPAIIVPYLALVRFKYAVELESGFTYSYSEDIRVKSVNQFVPCPWEFGAADVEVRFEAKWQGIYTPARRKTCCESCKEVDPREESELLDRCRID